MPLFIIIVFALANCTGNLKTGEESQSPESNINIEAEAYLFDARLYQNKKPTSFRWEIYQTDSIIGMAGRAYLGKGAFKGVVTKDSVSIYFPTTNEYLDERVEELLDIDNCLDVTTSISFFDIFFELPDSILARGKFDYSVYNDDDRVKYIINPRGCSWKLELTYKKQINGWRPEKFEIENGENRLKASLRTYKSSSKVPLSKFRVSFPPQATRISL